MAKEKRKVRVGEVIGDKMAKTVIVAVRWRQRHPLYNKAMPRVTKFYAHDAEKECRIGDIVRIEETRPISHLKRWRVVEIVERREVADVKPKELDRELIEQTQAKGVSDTQVPTTESSVPDMTSHGEGKSQ
jgi:small subunit ribosomal protein S17